MVWQGDIIYVFASQKETSQFFIVPRGEISKETGVCALDSWLFKYENACGRYFLLVSREQDSTTV